MPVGAAGERDSTEAPQIPVGAVGERDSTEAPQIPVGAVGERDSTEAPQIPVGATGERDSTAPQIPVGAYEQREAAIGCAAVVNQKTQLLLAKQLINSCQAFEQIAASSGTGNGLSCALFSGGAVTSTALACMLL